MIFYEICFRFYESNRNASSYFPPNILDETQIIFRVNLEKVSKQKVNPGVYA